ncbi:TolC family protein [Autumnicola edwardsiae]|uniref:TolC family protein n=1 Tax=Autumnicola edwardsiae TaxID=3075594 RepID=A0ABU3CYE8_9FLAO|nr:TolC family protein [Zunongwangia sp. F297]MDT0651390.1 TolC family protein [Zunongwangia sp. F297]
MKYFFLAAICLLSLNAFAQESYQLSVEEAVRYAIQNNPDLNKSRIDEQIVQEQIQEVKGRALPQINGSAQFTDNYSLAEQQLPAEIVGGEPGTTIGVAFGNRYAVTAGVNVQQELLNFQLFNSVRAAKALEELRSLQTLQSTEDLIINTVQIYVQVQITEKQVELLQENFNRTKSLVDLSELKYEEGIIKKLDVNQLRVNLTNLETQIEDAKYNRNEQLRLLKIYLNLPMETELVLSEKLEERDPYPIMNELILSSNIQYQQLQQQLELSEIDEDQVKAEYLPSLSAFFNYNYLGNTNEFQFSGAPYVDQFNGTWGISASIPIFDGFQRRNRLQQRELETRKLQEDQESLIKNIEKNYLDSKEQILLSQVQIENQNENMELAQENYDGIKLSYNEGVADLTELLDAEFALRQAQSNYLNALLQSRVAEVNLLRTSGQLSQLITNPN